MPHTMPNIVRKLRVTFRFSAIHASRMISSRSKVSRFQGFKVSRFQGFKIAKFQGFKVAKFQMILAASVSHLKSFETLKR
jgi:hypothetical protein